MKRSLCRSQLDEIKFLGLMVDYLHDSYKKIIKLHEHLESKGTGATNVEPATPKSRFLKSFTNKKVPTTRSRASTQTHKPPQQEVSVKSSDSHSVV